MDRLQKGWVMSTTDEPEYTDRAMLFDVDEHWRIRMHAAVFLVLTALAGGGVGAILAAIG